MLLGGVLFRRSRVIKIKERNLSMSDFEKNQLELDEDTLKNRFLTFMIDKETYGIEIRHVMEIIGIQDVIEMPEMPDYIKGIINLRGKIIPVLDVRLRFKKKSRNYDDRTCIIVIDFNDVWTGLVVDSVSEVLIIDDIIISPNISGNKNQGFVPNIGKRDGSVVLLIDCGKLLNGVISDNLLEISQ